MGSASPGYGAGDISSAVGDLTFEVVLRSASVGTGRVPPAHSTVKYPCIPKGHLAWLSGLLFAGINFRQRRILTVSYVLEEYIYGRKGFEASAEASETQAK